MIKDCPVIINNDAVTVVLYDEIEVQFPAINKKVTTLKVKFENGLYTIVEENTGKRKKTITEEAEG